MARSFFVSSIREPQFTFALDDTHEDSKGQKFAAIDTQSEMFWLVAPYSSRKRGNITTVTMSEFWRLEVGKSN